MIDIKKGTQAFSAAPQTKPTSLDTSSNISADKLKEVLGDNANIGELLNKVADPNFVAKPRVKGVGRSDLGKDDFLKLMLAQMKNQDPTSPLKSHEMAAQMAQFTSVEQLMNINSGIQGMQKAGASGSTSSNHNDALGFIGKVASGDSSKLYHQSSDDNHAFNFNLLKEATNAKIQIKDAGGDVIRTLEVSDLKKGANSIKWNGQTEDGLKAREGEYYFTVEARASNGAKVHAQTQFEGQISGVKFTPQGPLLLMGDQSISVRDVQKIIDPRFLAQSVGRSSDQKKASVNKLDLKDNDKIQQNGRVASVQAQAPKGNIGDLPMSRGLKNKLDKVLK